MFFLRPCTISLRAKAVMDRSPPFRKLQVRVVCLTDSQLSPAHQAGTAGQGMGATTHDTDVSLYAAENAYFKAGQGAGGENTWNYLLTTPFKARHKLAAAEFSSCQHVIEVYGRRSCL